MQNGTYKPKGFKVTPTSRTKIRKDAHIVLDVVRKVLEIKTPYLPIVDVIEFMAAENIIDIQIKEPFEMCGKAAELRPQNTGVHIIDIDVDVYDQACDNDYFSRFTLAHELGHLFLHANQRISLARSTSSSAHKAFEDSEWQANTFAGELLVDSRLAAVKCASILEIQQIFGVSSDTARIQWQGLKKENIL